MKKIIEAFLDGLRWPTEYNRHMHGLGLHWHVEPKPPVFERIIRAITWACYATRESTSDKIHPDGPR